MTRTNDSTVEILDEQKTNDITRWEIATRTVGTNTPQSISSPSTETNPLVTRLRSAHSNLSQHSQVSERTVTELLANIDAVPLHPQLTPAADSIINSFARLTKRLTETSKLY